MSQKDAVSVPTSNINVFNLTYDKGLCINQYRGNLAEFLGCSDDDLNCVLVIENIDSAVTRRATDQA